MKRLTGLFVFVLIQLIGYQANAQMLGGLSFDGNDNYIEVATSPLNTIGVGDFTIEVWVRGLESEQASHPMILSNRGAGSSGGGMLLFFHSMWGNSQYKMLCFQIDSDNYFLINNGSFDGSLLDGECHHLAITRVAETVRFYVDGSEIGFKTIPANLSINFDGPLLIGKDESTNNTFNGLISQCRIWNTARTQIQIEENKGLSLQGEEEGLIAYWEMDDMDGQLVTDKTGQYDGILGSSEVTDEQDPAWSDNGCVEATIVSTSDLTNENFLQVSPNPTTGLLTVQHQGTKNGLLNITDASGKLLLTLPLNEPILDVDISDFPKGIYFLQLQEEDHIISRKIIKS